MFIYFNHSRCITRLKFITKCLTIKILNIPHTIKKMLSNLLRYTTFFTFAMSCILKGPLTSRALPMEQQITFIFANVSSFKSCGGVTRVASPEWTPAFSTCSQTAIQITSPSEATASTSISC